MPPAADEPGAAAPAAAPPPPADPVPSVPSGPRPLHPRQVDVWRVGWGVVALVLLALVLGAELVVHVVGGVSLPWPLGAATAVAAVPLALAVWRVPAAAYDRWRYELAADTLELRRGVVVHRHTAIPYFRVQHIDISRSPVERALGLSELVVRTAAASTDATIPGVAAAEAESLRDVILARTGRDDAV